MQTETSTRVNSFKTAPMDLVSTCIQTVRSTKVIGKTTCKKVRAKKSSKTEASITACSRAARNGVLERMCGPTTLCTQVFGLTTTSKEKASIGGQTEEFTKDHGAKTSCTAVASTHGLTEEFTKESIRMTKSMGMVSTRGLMERGTMVAGETASSMGKLGLQTPRTAQN
jgi:hypothetical protein